MSPQVLELLIFAGIAFYIINKLISILGNTDEDAPIKKSSFGESVDIKDVTESGEDWTDRIKINSSPTRENTINKDILVFPDDLELVNNINELSNKIEKFTPESFIKNAAKARIMILESLLKKDNKTLEELVDKRYLEEVKSREEYYRKVDTNTLPDVKISDVTFFGNSIMIRLLINAKGLDGEEWTFSRNLNQTGPNWFLSNIERVA